MEDRGGAPPLNNQVPSEDAQAAQQVTSNQQAGYSQAMEIDSVSGQNVEASANSGAHNHSQAENQSEVQHLHTHTLVHRPRYNQGAQGNTQGRYTGAVSQGVPAATKGRQNNHQPRPWYNENVQPRHGQHNNRKRAYEPDFAYIDAYRSADQKEQRMGVQRLPLAGELLQQEPGDKVRYMNNGPKYKDQLELMGGNQSMVNWLAPDQRAKNTYGVQFVAKVATDDESLAALVKTIQLEARRQGSPIVNLWFQCQDPDEQRKLSKTVVSHTYNQLAPSYNVSIQKCTACGKAGHRVRECPKPDPIYFSIRMCSVCDTQNHFFDACSEVGKRLPLINGPRGSDVAHQDPNVIEAYKWFGEMLITRRVNKPPVRTSQVSWTTVAQYLYHHARDFKFHGAPWSLAFACKMAKAHRGDDILNGRTHWKDWDPSKGDKDEDLPADPLCQSLEVIVDNLRKKELTSERFVSAATRKVLSKNLEKELIEHLQVDQQPGGPRAFHIDLAAAPASVAHAVGGVPPKPAKPTVEESDQQPTGESDQQPRDRSMPITIKTEPDTEGSGITIPTELIKVPTEFVSTAEKCLHLFDDDDDVDPVDYIFESMPPTKSHNAVIQPVQMRPQALRATALRVAKNHSLKPYVNETTANEQGTGSPAASVHGDIPMGEDNSQADVSQHDQGCEEQQSPAAQTDDVESPKSDKSDLDLANSSDREGSPRLPYAVRFFRNQRQA